jgi:hypothetical protein
MLHDTDLGTEYTPDTEAKPRRRADDSEQYRGGARPFRDGIALKEARSKNARRTNHTRTAIENSSSNPWGLLIISLPLATLWYAILKLHLTTGTPVIHHTQSLRGRKASLLFVLTSGSIEIPCHHVPMSIPRPLMHHMESQCECIRTNTKPIPPTPICLRLPHTPEKSESSISPSSWQHP